MNIYKQKLFANNVTASKHVLTTKDVRWIAIMAFLLPVGFIEYSILEATDGTFSYPIDDVYIHMAIAKNVALHHVWGISPHEFVSASSSLIYPLLLSVCVKLFGSHIITPFAINILASIIFIIVLQNWLIRQQLRPSSQLATLLITILAIPLPVIAMSGMEHTLQILFCFLFISNFSEALAKLPFSKSRYNQSDADSIPKWSLPSSVYIFGILLTMTRYESLAFIIIGCLILMIHRKIRYALLLGFASTIPTILFGIYSILHGNHFLPNSVLLKSGAPSLTKDSMSFFFSEGIFAQLSLSQGVYTLAATQRIFILLLITFLLFQRKANKTISYQYLFIFLIATTFLQLTLSSSGQFPGTKLISLGAAQSF